MVLSGPGLGAQIIISEIADLTQKLRMAGWPSPGVGVEVTALADPQPRGFSLEVTALADPQGQ